MRQNADTRAGRPVPGAHGRQAQHADQPGLCTAALPLCITVWNMHAAASQAARAAQLRRGRQRILHSAPGGRSDQARLCPACVVWPAPAGRESSAAVHPHECAAGSASCCIGCPDAGASPASPSGRAIIGHMHQCKAAPSHQAHSPAQPTNNRPRVSFSDGSFSDGGILVRGHHGQCLGSPSAALGRAMQHQPTLVGPLPSHSRVACPSVPVACPSVPPPHCSQHHSQAWCTRRGGRSRRARALGACSDG